MADLVPVMDTATCRIEARNPPRPGAQGRVLLSFTGIGHDMGGVDVQKIEFYGTGRAFDNVLFLSDLTRSWGNALDFVAIAQALAPYLDGAEVHAIGNSMGGFLAVEASNHLPVRSVVATSPQFSVSPEVMPKERRWRRHVAAIETFHLPSLEGRFRRDCRYYLFSGAVGPDRNHWRRFPKQENVVNVILGWTAHDVAAKLKKRGVLADLAMACFEDRFSIAWMRRHVWPFSRLAR